MINTHARNARHSTGRDGGTARDDTAVTVKMFRLKCYRAEEVAAAAVGAGGGGGGSGVG